MNKGKKRRRTFCTFLFHSRPPTRTLTVFGVRPARTTTPCSSRNVFCAAATIWVAMTMPRSKGAVGRSFVRRKARIASCVPPPLVRDLSSGGI